MSIKCKAANKRTVITGNGLKVATGVVSYSDASTIFVTFATLPLPRPSPHKTSGTFQYITMRYML